MSSIAWAAISSDSVFCSRMASCGVTKRPPLKPAIGVSSLRSSMSLAMPRGGRPLVMAKRMPISRSLSTAAWARLVSTFCSLTSVPSTSARTSEIFRFSTISPRGQRSVQRSPSATIACQQLVSCGRTVATSDIVRKIPRRIVGPRVEDGLYRAPSCLDVVGPLEQRRVADHAVVEQRFVSGVARDLEIRLVGEVHANGVELHRQAGALGCENEGDAFVGLDAEDHPVGIHPLHMGAAKKRVRRLMEANGDLCPPAFQIFACAQVERNASPTPVVDLQFAGEEGFGIRIRRDVGLLAISSHWPAKNGAGIVLSAHDVLQHPRGLEWTYGFNDLRLLGPDRIRIERDRRLHGRHREQLKHMVGHHVTQRASVFVEFAPALDSYCLRHRDLDVIDMLTIPQRLEHAVGKV